MRGRVGEKTGLEMKSPVDDKSCNNEACDSGKKRQVLALKEKRLNKIWEIKFYYQN